MGLAELGGMLGASLPGGRLGCCWKDWVCSLLLCSLMEEGRLCFGVSGVQLRPAQSQAPSRCACGGLFALVPCHCYFCQWQAVEANYFHYLFACLFSLSEVKLSVV